MPIPVLGIALSALGLAVDYMAGLYIEGQVSQFDQLLNLIETGATMADFVQECWLILILGGFVFWAGLSLAFPKKRRTGR